MAMLGGRCVHHSKYTLDNEVMYSNRETRLHSGLVAMRTSLARLTVETRKPSTQKGN